MLNHFPFLILIGFFTGTLAGLGVGGGSLLMLWLTLIAGRSAQEARTVNLMFFVLSSGIGCLIRILRKKQPMRGILPAVLTGCLAAAVFSHISIKLETEWYRKLFGVYFLVSGIREILYRPRKAR